MGEEDVRDGLLNAVADEPPLRFDPDELMATARGQVRRRALVAVGLATVAVAVAAVAVPIALGRDSTTTVPAATRPGPAGPSSDQRPQPTRYTVDDLRERGRELRVHLSRSLPAALPSATKIIVGEFGGEATGDFYPGQTSINATITFSIKGARYSIMVTTWVPDAAPAPADMCVANCHRLDDQAGGAVFQQTHDMDKGVVETVFHYRDTGAVVSVAAYNYDMTSTVPPVYHPSLPVTRDALLAIATDPELAL
ncbi:hypothetical protein [Actinophytocola sp. NPDC049390]|uniref:hypothetical protein n=1 Tax=Actinophytocola sp. NPDC049390 TaxID=3363894 RepID=UPI00378AA307